MKRAIVLLVVIVLVILTTVSYILSADTAFKPADILQLSVLALVVGFAIFMFYKRVTSAKRGEPVEDELSKKIVQKTAALSYFISLYIWVAMLFIKDRVKLDTEEIIGMGILGMAITFALCWIILNFRGMKNE